MFFLITLISFFLFSTKLFAYVGLGPLIPILGNAIIFLFFTAISVIGLFFYPIKKLLSIIKKNKKKYNDNKKD